MKEKQLKTLIFILILICGVWIWKDSNNIKDLMSENSNLESENGNLQAQIDEYSDALDEANSNIEQANANIEDAQNYAWSSYEDMGYALDNLETVDTISAP